MSQPFRSVPLDCACQAGQDSVPYLRLRRHTIMRCRECGGAWTSPRPGEVDYSSNDFHSAFVIPDEAAIDSSKLPWEWRRSLDVQVRMLQSVLAPGAHVHEVGCGQGMLLEMLRKAGYRVTGIEPSTSASQVALAKRIEVETGYFGAENTIRKADCVVFSHVLKHIGEPQRALSDAAALVPEGYLLCFQTNYRGLIPRLTREKWGWIPEEHFWHFTPESLTRWVVRHGFEPVELKYVSLVQGNWKSKLAQFVASRLPRAHDGFIALYKRAPKA